MANTLKLNSTEAMTKSDRQARNNVINKAKNSDKSGLIPDENLNSVGRKMFKSIVKNNDSLNSSDNYSVNMLCLTYQTYKKAVNILNKNGLVDSRGRKSPYYSIMKQSTDTLVKLGNELMILPKNRLTADYQNESDGSTDPVTAVLK